MKNYNKYIFSFLLFMLAHKVASACMCNEHNKNTIYYTSYMIADVKVLKITPDPNNFYLSTIEVEIVNLIKGKKHTKLKIFDSTRSYIDENGNTASSWTSCSLTMKVGTVYRVAPKFRNGNIVIDMCNYIPYYDGLNSKYTSSKKIKVSNDTLDLTPSTGEFLQLLAPTEIKNDFAIIEFTLNRNLSVKSKKFKKNFSSIDLNKALIKAVENVTFKSRTLNRVKEGTKVSFLFDSYSETRKPNSFAIVSKI